MISQLYTNVMDADVRGSQQGFGLFQPDLPHEPGKGMSGHFFDIAGTVRDCIIQVVRQLGQCDGIIVGCKVRKQGIICGIRYIWELLMGFMFPYELSKENGQHTAKDPVGVFIAVCLLLIHLQQDFGKLGVPVRVEHQAGGVVLSIQASQEEGGDESLVLEDIEKDVFDGISADQDIEDDAVIICHGQGMPKPGGQQAQVAARHFHGTVGDAVDTSAPQNIDDLEKDMTVLKCRGIAVVPAYINAVKQLVFKIIFVCQGVRDETGHQFFYKQFPCFQGFRVLFQEKISQRIRILLRLVIAAVKFLIWIHLQQTFCHDLSIHKCPLSNQLLLFTSRFILFSHHTS